MQPCSSLQPVFELLEELKSLFFNIFFFLFYFLDLFRIRVVNSSGNVELRSLFIEFHLCKWNLRIFLESSLFSLIQFQ